MMAQLYADAYNDGYENPLFSLPTTLTRTPINTRLITEKLEVPDIRTSIQRPRLSELLGRSLANYTATLICGRSGTGKTTAAAICHSQRRTASWYSVTLTDADWTTFALHFEASIRRDHRSRIVSGTDFSHNNADISSIEAFLLECLTLTGCPDLVVIDDAHHLFESHWFVDFLAILIRLLPPSSHLLMTCRSRPPAPLWRLRSKQVLNVIDEKLLYFSAEEAEGLYSRLDIDMEQALAHQRLTFGHPQKLLKLATEVVFRTAETRHLINQANR